MTHCSESHQVLNSDSQQALDACRIVLVQPSLSANIGSAVRAMTTMGLHDLVVVSPHDPGFRHDPDTLARAGGARERVHHVRSCDSLDEALADCHLAVAVSAEGREFGPPPEFPLGLCGDVVQQLAAGQLARVAFVFGTERSGLRVEEMARCQRWLTIPADAAYNSLNVAQAVQIVAFSLRQAVLARGGQAPSVAGEIRQPPEAGGVSGAGGQTGANPAAGLAGAHAPADATLAAGSEVGSDAAVIRERLATLGALEGLLRHAEASLTALGTLNPARPRRLMARLRHLFNRARPDQDEIDMLHGICRDIDRLAARAAENRAAQGRQG
ncbi:MAG: TrmH family RNA methyltransferase [Lautropia sp.]|nr:TrmH family RNA methyltransferase [Lautropia sp.]